MATIGIDASRGNNQQRTGTEWYSYNLLKRLPILAPEDHFVWYLRSPLLPDLQPLPQNVTARYLRWPPRLFWTQVRLSAHLLRTRPDVLFVPAHTLPFVQPAKTVTTLHDIGFERFPKLYSFQERAYHRLTTRFALHTATTVIVVSQFTKQELMHFYPDLDPSRVVVIPNGFTPLPKIQTTTRDIAGVRLDQPFFLYVGRLEYKKNTDGLLTAYQHLRHYGKSKAPLVLVGFWGQHSAAIQRQLRDHPFAKDIIQLGYQPQPVQAQLLAHCTAFVFPSRYEGFGFPPLEAMAAGAPVIAARAGSLPEVCGEAAHYVDPEDTVALAAAMDYIAGNSSVRQELINLGNDQWKKFSWEATAQATLAVIKKAIR